jgi:hypothetical protein
MYQPNGFVSALSKNSSGQSAAGTPPEADARPQRGPRSFAVFLPLTSEACPGIRIACAPMKNSASQLDAACACAEEVHGGFMTLSIAANRSVALIGLET